MMSETEDREMPIEKDARPAIPSPEHAAAEPASAPSPTAQSHPYPLTSHTTPTPTPEHISDPPTTLPIQVFLPSAASGSTPTSSPPTDLDDTFFESTLADVQAHHASAVARSKRLNQAPLLTSKFRDQDKLERDRRKADKWPTTTIRIRFSDGTLIQSTFPSTSPIQPVYAFVRSALDPSASSKPFVLWQPPRTQYPEHPPSAPPKKPNPHRSTVIAPADYGPIRGGQAAGMRGGTGGKESLNDLGFVPQSVLLVKWEDEGMNASGYRAPLRAELMERGEPLPPAVPKAREDAKKEEPKSGGEKKIPKWLQKGLMKRK